MILQALARLTGLERDGRRIKEGSGEIRWAKERAVMGLHPAQQGTARCRPVSALAIEDAGQRS